MSTKVWLLWILMLTYFGIIYGDYVKLHLDNCKNVVIIVLLCQNRW